jgi:hypothetical protein
MSGVACTIGKHSPERAANPSGRFNWQETVYGFKKGVTNNRLGLIDFREAYADVLS